MCSITNIRLAENIEKNLRQLNIFTITKWLFTSDDSITFSPFFQHPTTFYILPTTSDRRMHRAYLLWLWKRKGTSSGFSAGAMYIKKMTLHFYVHWIARKSFASERALLYPFLSSQLPHSIVACNVRSPTKYYY